MNLNRMLAEAEIRSLVTRERYYRDSGQWDKLRNAYHPDASKTWIDITWYKGHIDGFVRGSEEMARKGSTSMHVIHPVEIGVNGAKAFSVSVGNITARFTRDEIEYDLVSTCRFLSRLERWNGPDEPAWKMLTMEVIYIHDSVIRVIPETWSSTFNLPHDDTHPRKSYKFLALLLAARGHKVNNDLPGVDDEQSVREVMDRNLNWLNA